MLIGVDIIKNSRVAKAIEKPNFLKRLLSEDERLLVNGRVESIAGFWAAKEAFVKALGTGFTSEITLSTVAVGKEVNGRPTLKIPEDILTKYNINGSSVSISHDGEYTIATVILY